MKSFSAIVLLAVPLGAFALTITSPSAGDTWNSTGDRTVTWTSTSSDDAEFGMYLVNTDITPSQNLPINDQVKTSSGSYTFSNVLPVGKNYLIRFSTLNTPSNGTLADSGKFNIVSGGPNAVAGSSVSGSSTPGTTPTPTPTPNGSGSNSSTPNGSTPNESGSSASGSTSTPTATGKSSGSGTYGSRGVAIALGVVSIGFAAMIVVA